MKSQLMTALSIVGVLGTATTAMAVNTDALASLDSGAIDTATDTLLPDSPATDQPIPTATPAPLDPSAAPVDPTTAPQSGGTSQGGSSQTVNSGSAPVVQPAQATVVNGTSGGSGSRVDPATGATVPNYEDDDDHDDDDHDDDDDHEEEEDDD
jgi:hypothetical protein